MTQAHPHPHDVALEQFTRQAPHFAAAPTMQNEEALQLLVRLTSPSPADTLLDVACGPGIVVCAFAPHVRQATGLDLVPAMIEQARSRQAALGCSNVVWQIGPAAPLPWPAHTFSLVTCRYAFHHFADPTAVFAEMDRVCAPGGRIALVDVAASPDPVRAEAYNRVEKWRDPSHERALPRRELEALFQHAGLPGPRADEYQIEFELETLLAGSFPQPGDADKVRSAIRAAAGTDALGMEVRAEAERLYLAYPIVALVAQKPAPTL